MDQWRVLGQALEHASALVVITLGSDHEFVYANQRFRDVFGDLAGTPVPGPRPAGGPGLAGEGLRGVFDEVYRTGRPVVRRRGQVEVAGAAGPAARSITFTASPLRARQDGPVEGVLVVGVDLDAESTAGPTPARDAERGVAHRDAGAPASSQRLDRVARELIGAARPADVLAAVRRAAGESLGAVTVHLAVADAASSVDTISSVDTMPMSPMPAPEATPDPVPEAAPAGTGEDRAWATFPMLDGQNLVGVLRVAFPHPRELGEAERAFLRALASLCAPAWQRVTRFDELERAADALARSELRYRTLSEATSLDVWRAAPTGELLSDMPRWRAFTGGGTREITGEGWLADVHPADRDRAAAIWADSVATGRPYDSTFRIRASDGRWRHIRSLGVPVREHGSPTGEIVEWIGRTTDVTDALVAQRQVRAAAAYASALAAAATREDVLRVLTEITAPSLGAVGVAIAWLGAGRLHLRGSGSGAPRGTWEYPGDVSAERTVLPPLVRTLRVVMPSFVPSPADLRALMGEAPGSDGAEFDGPHPEDLIETLTCGPATSWAFFPVAAGGRVVGALALAFADPEDYRSLDREFLYGVASQHGSALERARLYETERDASLTLQKALQPGVPASLPWLAVATVHQTSPGVDVGGDWAEVLPLPTADDPRQAALVVGDVMGRGLVAAANMGNIRAAVRALAASDPRPEAVAGGLDRLFETFGDDVLITCWYGLLTPDGALRHVNAGHPPPIVLAADGSTRLLPAGRGWPLGVTGLGSRPVDSDTLRPGQTLLVYSDGLVETPTVSFDEGLAALRVRAGQAPVASGATGELAAWADALVGSITAQGTDDDATLLVARL